MESAVCTSCRPFCTHRPRTTLEWMPSHQDNSPAKLRQGWHGTDGLLKGKSKFAYIPRLAVSLLGCWSDEIRPQGAPLALRIYGGVVLVRHYTYTLVGVAALGLLLEKSLDLFNALDT